MYFPAAPRHPARNFCFFSRIPQARGRERDVLQEGALFSTRSPTASFVRFARFARRSESWDLRGTSEVEPSLLPPRSRGPRAKAGGLWARARILRYKLYIRGTICLQTGPISHRYVNRAYFGVPCSTHLAESWNSVRRRRGREAQFIARRTAAQLFSPGRSDPNFRSRTRLRGACRFYYLNSKSGSSPWRPPIPPSQIWIARNVRRLSSPVPRHLLFS